MTELEYIWTVIVLILIMGMILATYLSWLRLKEKIAYHKLRDDMVEELRKADEKIEALKRKML